MRKQSGEDHATGAGKLDRFKQNPSPEGKARNLNSGQLLKINFGAAVR
jgi:hypothetical protein